MLKSEGFDSWAGEYDDSVQDSDENHSYPFAGYSRVLRKIEEEISAKDSASVLDIGFGTAVLTSRLYEKGCSITGIDFSEQMIAIAQKKMPLANLIHADFSTGLPHELSNERFDFIVATYSFHHVIREMQADFLRSLTDHLSGDGKIFIGDVMFRTKQDFDACHKKFVDVWDEDEAYPIADDLAKGITPFGLSCEFHPLTFCSGVLIIS